MRPQNVLLTVWLALPILIVGLFVWWIFQSFRSGPLMDEPAIGQGAGDTGGANAFGEFLAGNDPGAIQARNQALHDGRLIDPLDWPGGVTLHVGAELAGPDPVLFVAGPTAAIGPTPFRRSDDGYSLAIRPGSLVDGGRLYVGPAGSTITLDAGRWIATGPDGRRLAASRLEPIAPPPDAVRDQPLESSIAGPIYDDG